MRPFLVEFSERRREVRRYIAVLKFMEKNLDDKQLRRRETEWRIFRAGAMLILYNAVEASARSAIQAIYDEISETGTKFEDLRESIRKRVIADFKKNAGADTDHGMKNVATEIITTSFKPENLFSGNVDARTIRDQSKIYGFSGDVEYSRTKNGEDLLIVKSKRNDLAHGITSFSEVGRDYTASDIYDISKYCMCYLESILNNVNLYLEKHEYRQENQENVPPENLRRNDSSRSIFAQKYIKRSGSNLTRY